MVLKSNVKRAERQTLASWRWGADSICFLKPSAYAWLPDNSGPRGLHLPVPHLAPFRAVPGTSTWLFPFVAHRKEVEVGVTGHVSAPPSGAAAAAPPEGAQ
jgi:hypothetical protein